jgi:protein-ribulosamine 3-kinase
VTLPGPVQAGVERAMAEWTGRPTTIRRAAAVAGGCISPTARIETDSGDTFFLKYGASGLPAGLLDAEAAGLRALARADAVRVPQVVGVGGEGSSVWLLMEWLEPGPARGRTWTELGRGLAALHQHRAARFGAETANFIGSLPQQNTPHDDWAAFWRTRRLEPQLRTAVQAGLLDGRDRARFARLFDHLEDSLAPARDDGPSLLHGDLWNGNVHPMDDGSAALIDPSAYHGHREVDLAMADLFGGFPPAFRSAYEEVWPLAPGYAPRRRAIYQLYYLLVHVNLFGRSYVGRTRGVLEEVTAKGG